jgi:TrmH family RNA methyltransferase
MSEEPIVNQGENSSIVNNIVVVLYQPQDIVNVGGIVRVMSNFGLSRLRLVEPAAWDAYRVEGIAHHTRPIIEAAEFFPTLEAALADCGFVLGTTARKRGVRRERLTPRLAAPLLLDAARKSPHTPAALLFGREDSGLPNEALDDCHALVTIPTAPENASLNLAQAALLLAYEIFLSSELRAASFEPEADSLQPEESHELRAVSRKPKESYQPSAISQINSEQSSIVNRQSSIGTPPKYGEPTSVEEAVAQLQADAQLATGTERETMFKALADLLWALFPGTNETRIQYSMTRLRAVLLRAAPRGDEARALSHLFHHLTRRVKNNNE